METDVVSGTRVWVNDSFAGRFEVFVYGGRNTLFSWSQMAFVVPLESVDGGVYELLLEDGIEMKAGSESGSGSGSGGLPVSNEARRSILGVDFMAAVVGMMVMYFSLY
jgi:hexosaminidase